MPASSPLEELLEHLIKVRDDPQEAFRVGLVEQSRYSIRETGVQTNQVLQLTDLTLTLLRTSKDDLDPLITLLSEAFDLVSFDDLQSSIPVEVVTEGLSSPSPSIQGLALSYLKKASQSPSGAAFVANDDALVKALIKLFLTSKSADIGGTKALEVIISLLSVDNPDHITTLTKNGQTGQTTGQGLLWRRVFHDDEIYNLFFHFTSTSNSSNDFSKSDVTTAQARLLDFISAVAKMRWDAISDPKASGHQSPMQPRAGSSNHTRSLLRYSTHEMIDRDDPLMANILVDFLVKLLELKNPQGCSGIASIPATSSPSLEFLVASGLHQRAIDYYLRSEDFDAFEIQFLGGAQIRYLCSYTDLYPEHFLSSPAQAEKVVNRLNRNLQISGARWAHGTSPVQDLNVLAHVPAAALLRASGSEQNPLMILPTNPANADALQTLAKVFHGPESKENDMEEDLTVGSNPSSKGARAASARALFYQYHDKHPEFWSNVGAAMNVLAMAHSASAATGLVRSMITAVWARLPDDGPQGSGPQSLPMEQKLKELCGGDVSQTGLAELLNAGDIVIQSLLTPLRTMGGDAEAARLAWRLGTEKFDVLILISDLMKKGVGKAEVPKDVWQRIGERIQERIRHGAASGFTTQTNLVGTMGR
jgi:DNA mismatch repair protein HSM3, N terminal domain